MRRPLIWLLSMIAVGGSQLHLNAASPAAPDFTQDVRPILSQRCFKCHGPDDGARKSKLRLDVRESAILPAKSGAIAIVPGKPAESELVRRILSTDEDERMPPPSTKAQLTPAEKETLNRWVAAGAEYKPHWAFVNPKPAPPSPVKNSSWPRNAIDRFVLARLEKEGLAPSPPADRTTLARRVYFDLIGLPPTPEEADAFANDPEEDAYESLVDGLLSSPYYGERWGRRWMDLARYADTNGYEKDRQRSLWPWRDWVIKALNADMPFDQFTIEQIAGDMLANASRDQRIATGFHRNTMLNEEGGIDPLEFRFHAMTDRVGTTGATWLGLTVGCAQCHTHKYDPISHREYYQMMAFLNNVDEPDLDLPEVGFDKQRQANLEKAAKLLGDLPNKFPTDSPAGKPNGAATDGSASGDKSGEPLDNRPLEVRRREVADKAFGEWLSRERARSVQWIPLRPREAKSNMPLLTVQPDHSVFASGDITKRDTYELSFRTELRGITAVRLEALPDERLPRHGPGMAYYEGPKGDFFMGEFQMSANGKALRFAGSTQSYAKNNFGSSASASMATDGDPQTGWSTAGREGERHEAVFPLAEPQTEAGELQLKMMFGRHYACSLGRFRISVTTHPGGAQARDLSEEVVRLLQIPEAGLTGEDRTTLREHFLLTTPELAGARGEIESLRKPPAHVVTMVMRERPPENPRHTFIHKRGEFLQPTERVEPGVISAVAPFPADLPRNRLGFARWLVSTNNPLTARVTANRQWQAFFLRGLVRTTEDFGFQGEMPSHPELLDWLALEFMRQGWSLKKLHKIIVMSATYRQSSRVTPELLARDSENRLYARGPHGRLDAELIRDAALKASGLLSIKMGGPSVYPPQPAGVTEVAFGSPAWSASQGEDRHRRSLYTFMKRTAPFAMFNTFDAPTGESCVARRDVSNTPLQALTILNDVCFVEVSQAMGRILTAQGGAIEVRIRDAFRRCLTRPPRGDEVAVLARFFEVQKQRFMNKELDAKAIAGEGSGDVMERAAWTALARAILNLDEMITKS